MNIIKLDQKIDAFMKAEGLSQRRVITINQMTVILILFYELADNVPDIAKLTKKSTDAARSTVLGLTGKVGNKRGGIDYVKTDYVIRKANNGRHASMITVKLTQRGKKFAKLIAPFFKG